MRLASALLVAVVLASPRAAAADPIDETCSDAQVIALPVDPGDTLAVPLVHRGDLLELRLHRVAVRAPGFRLRVFTEGVTREVEPPPSAAWRGEVAGHEGSLVAGSLGPNGLHVRVALRGGDSFEVRPLGPPGLHGIVSGEDWPAGLACGVDDAGGASPGMPSAATGAEPARVQGEQRAFPSPREPSPSPLWCGATGMKLAEIAFDVDEPYFQQHGADLVAVLANVDGHVAIVDAFYARDALITYRLTDVIVRTTPFYLPDPMNQGSLLVLFRDEWRANQVIVQRDIAHLLTGQPAPGLAGLAYVGVTCSQDWAFGWSVDSSGVVGHELGHNWNAGHCADVTPCNNMCGACLLIGPVTKGVIMAFRESRTCLDDVPARTEPTDPYAHPDTLALTRAEALARLPLPIDVLANDHDADCGDLVVSTFDPVTPRGGRVTLDAAGGPGGRDRLLYEPPCRVFAGADTFRTTIDDGTGRTASANVTVDVDDPGLLALWDLDEGAGLIAGEATGWRRDGTLSGGAAWTAGRFGSALDLDGVDGEVTVPALNLPAPPVTLTAWVRRSGNLPAFAGILFSRAAGTTAGLHVGPANDLRYTWSNDAATFGFASGLVLPDGVWAFVALVLEADRATLWLDDGATWMSAVNVTPHVPQSFAGVSSLGRDPTGAARYFRGALDEIRVFSGALTEAELLALRDGASRAEAPRPADGGFASDPGLALSWRPAPAATAHDVYLGVDLAAVLAATPQDVEYRGRVTVPSLPSPGFLASGTTHAWRVDEVIGGVPVPGDAWLFDFASESPQLAASWRLDEGAGTTAGDGTAGGRDGALENGATWSAGMLSGAVSLDGVDDLVRIPALDLASHAVTFTAWVRTNGTPAPWAGLIFSRAAGTTAGFNLRGTAELGYHWNGGNWGWSSGLVLPADTWVFVALAMAPDHATVYLHDGALLSEATNVANHGPEGFGGDLILGRDPWGAARSFRGELDDVRVYAGTLTRAEILAVHDTPARASTPSPADGAVLAAPPGALAFVPGAESTEHELYLGTDAAAVRAATFGSPEHVGRLASPVHLLPPPGLPPGSWAWRVDALTPGGTVTGATWSFAIFGEPPDGLRVTKDAAGAPRLAWPRVAFASGTTVLRCEPGPAVPCVPAPAAATTALATTWTDPAAAAIPLIWYQITPDPCLP